MGREIAELADAYLRHYRRSRAEAAAGRKLDADDPDVAAFDRVLDFVLTDDVQALWEVNIELIRKCESIDELSYVAAGPVEDMLVRLGDDETGAVLSRASEDPRWNYAIAATCTHAGGPLDEGELQGEVVQCPWHGSRFRMRDGKPITGPATFAQPRYDVRVRDGMIQLRRR